KETIAARLRGGFMGATEIADDLARRGMPFRDAHELVGRIVLYAQEQGRELWELSPDEYREFSPLLDASVVEAATPAGAVARKRSRGGTAPERVQEQVQAVRGALTENLSWLASRPAVPVERDAAAPGVQPGGAPRGADRWRGGLRAARRRATPADPTASTASARSSRGTPWGRRRNWPPPCAGRGWRSPRPRSPETSNASAW